MPKPNETAPRLDDTTHDHDSASLSFRGDAANDARSHEREGDEVDGAEERPSLEVLARRLGAPKPVMQRVAFSGYDESVGLEDGRAVASERILQSVPAFVHVVDTTWNAMSEMRRGRVLGYSAGLLPVLVSEAHTLEELNDRYDRVARNASRTRAQCEVAARNAMSDGRETFDESLRAVRRFVPPGEQERAGLDAATDKTDTPAALALSIEMLSDWISGWLSSMSPDEVDVYVSMGFGSELVATLRAKAVAVRETQADLDSLYDENRVTQRQLDMQDGRVLHVFGVVYGAFRAAAKRDDRVVLPPLGELRSFFERWSARRRAEEPADPTPPQPGPQPA